MLFFFFFFFFFNDTATTEIYTLSLHDALPISVDPVSLKPLTTILELAQKKGFKTGNVTTAELTDATPAVLDSHISLRGCQGPADMATCPNETKQAGGLGSIAEQSVDHNVDVLMGGGRNRFT